MKPTPPRLLKLRLLGLILLLAFASVLNTAQPAVAQEPDDPEAAATGTLAPIAPALVRAFARQRGPVPFLVILDDQLDVDAVLASLQVRSASVDARRAQLYQELTRHAQETQTPLRRLLESKGIPYQAFYLVNMLEVTGDAALAETLRRQPSVSRLAANPSVALDLPAQSDRTVVLWPRSTYVPNTTPIPEQPYGIRYANAPQVWAEGFTGQGIVLASQDTGVNWEHVALKTKYRGWDSETMTATHEYNWFDAWGTANRNGCDPDPQVPCDDSGHGTHTVGTMVGSDSQTALTVGMAPNAQWIGCRNMNRGNGTPASYTACFEFFMAPYPQGRDKFSEGDPSKAPDIINNSWYCPPEEGCDFDSLHQIVKIVRTAGLMVIASAGNNGPVCSSVKYPISAYPEVFSIGAHDHVGNIVSFSSRGPVTADGSNRMKPEISAAGRQVMSTSVGGDYIYLSGTSMASPHVAGAAALLWSAVPVLKRQIGETEQILMKSAQEVLANDCNEGPQPQTPNNTYGHGRLDALAALHMAQQPATLSVQVGEQRSAISGTVYATDIETGYVYAALIDGSGTATFDRIYAGNYVITLDSSEATSPGAVLALTANEQLTIPLKITFNLYYPIVSR